MQNLFQFFIRYHLFFIFLLLEVFSFYLVYRYKHYNEVAYLNVANNATGKMYSAYSTASEYLYLRKFSDSLVQENARLRADLAQSKYSLTKDTGSIIDSSSSTLQLYSYLSARVIYNSVNRASNLIYLDRGYNQGIRKQMGVINGNGIVGQIVGVTDNYSAAISVLSNDFKVSAKVLKNDFFGNVSWLGVNSTDAKLEDIPKHVNLKIGDTIVTSGFSALFPRNIMVGTVTTVNMKPDKNFLDVTIKLTTNFSNLSYVYVVDNLHKEELFTLDSLAQKND